jgi:small-conductance mechanosensitive channel
MKKLLKVLFSLSIIILLSSTTLAQKKLALEKDTTIENVTQVDSIINNKNIKPQSFPVMGFFNDTLVLIYNKLGSFTAKDRVIAISERINKLKDDFSFDNTSLKVVETETTFDIVNGENIIMSVSQKDAISNKSTKKELAELYRKKITDAVVNYKKETSYSTLLKEISQAFLVFIVLILFIYFISKFFRSFSTKISNQEGSRFHDIKIKNYTLIEASKQIGLITSILNFFKWIFIILLINISLPIIFSFFPWTQPYAKNLFSYVINPIKLIAINVWHYLPNLITIIVICIVFKYVLKAIRFLKNEIEQGKLQLSGFYPDWANPTFQILRVLLYAFMFVLIFPYLPGSNSPIFQGVSVFLGFLFTFGSAGSLSNSIAGIILTYMRLYKIGDRVKIGEVVGDVIEKTLLVTRVKTIKNEIISIPNSTVMSSHTINYSNESENGNGLIMHTTVTIGYDVPWKDMHQALLNAADRTNLLQKEPKPFVLQTSLEDFYVSYQINAYTKEPNKQAGIYSELHQNIQDCCNEVGIEILSPHYRAGRDGNMTTIPANYLDKNYKAPSFNINIENNSKNEE